MFTKNRKPPPIKSLIGEGVVVRGEIRFTDGLRIDGEVQGDVLSEGDTRSIVAACRIRSSKSTAFAARSAFWYAS